MDKLPRQLSAALQQQVAGLLLFREVLACPAGEAFAALLGCLEQENRSLQAYGRWFAALAASGQSWHDLLCARVLADDNPFSQQVQRRALTEVPESLVSAARSDLRALQAIASCTPEEVSRWVQVAEELAIAPVPWQVPSQATVLDRGDWAAALADLAEHYRRCGTGLFGRVRAARWQRGQLVGVAYPDPVRVADLAGYDTQKQVLLQNTRALLAGYPALDVLLYGSRGTGKSSLVKAVLHEFSGLRLIEVAKADLVALPRIVEQVRSLPQKFAIFVDDLSFEDDDDAFKALKVVLEGGTTARAANIVVYATSNRRHLVREYFADRPRPAAGDEIHAWDTMQEKLSFGDRFGLTLTFEPPDQERYLAIARHLARRAGIDLSDGELEARAKQWATRHNGRSGRSARQFVDYLQAELALARSAR